MSVSTGSMKPPAPLTLTASSSDTETTTTGSPDLSAITIWGPIVLPSMTVWPASGDRRRNEAASQPSRSNT